MSRIYRWLPTAALTLAVTSAVVIGAASSGATRAPAAALPSSSVASSSGVLTGVYAGPALIGTTGLSTFDAATQVSSTQVLDFAATDTWANIEGPAWMLTPHSQQSARLEYSLPMFPAGAGNSLTACASGTYDGHWATLGAHLVAAHLANTVVRPGWEFNGDWYGWSAVNQAAAYVGCFRHIVTTMRAVAGQRFSFDWNVALGDTKMAGATTTAYPGDAYVDYVGVDVYDTSWNQYLDNAPTANQQAAAWKYLLGGPSGLAFWSTFAAGHGKPLSIPEWGVARLANGHGGGDDPAFVTSMFAFLTDPANHVGYEHYFNWNAGTTMHSLTSGQFPKSLAAFRAGIAALTARAPVTAAGPGRAQTQVSHRPLASRRPMFGSLRFSY